jgi:hypothetical protein
LAQQALVGLIPQDFLVALEERLLLELYGAYLAELAVATMELQQGLVQDLAAVEDLISHPHQMVRESQELSVEVAEELVQLTVDSKQQLMAGEQPLMDLIQVLLV